MKTPREILFDRHRHAGPALDRLRQDTVAQIEAQNRTRAADQPRFAPSWAALFRSLRWHLAGLSAAWLIIGLLSLASPHEAGRTVARRGAVSPRQLLTALRENRQQLLELIQPPAVESAPRPPAVVPPRRSGLQSSNTWV